MKPREKGIGRSQVGLTLTPFTKIAPDDPVFACSESSQALEFRDVSEEERQGETRGHVGDRRGV